MEDKTKRGLTVKERSLDDKLKVESEKGMIHDMDGIGHWVPIRWFFPKNEYYCSHFTKRKAETPNCNFDPSFWTLKPVYFIAWILHGGFAFS